MDPHKICYAYQFCYSFVVTILVAVIVVFGLWAVLRFGIGWLVENQPGPHFGILSLLLSLTFAPFYQHYQIRSQEVRGWQESVEERFGEEALTRLNSALHTYQWVTVVGGVVLFLLALVATKVHPILGGYLPSVSFVLYFLSRDGKKTLGMPLPTTNRFGRRE